MPTDRPALPPRAGIALLTLQLRAALREAEEAEDDAAIDHEAAREQLRARLGPLVEERRRSLDESLAAARVQAETKIAAARRAATVMAAQAPKRSAPPVIVTQAAIPVVEPVVVPIGDAPRPNARQDDLWRPAGASATGAVPAGIPTVAAGSPSNETVVAFDAEQMATVFASVLATMLDDRMSRWAPAPPPRKPSFLSHVFHPDVVLVGIIMIVSMIVVAAWMS